MSIAWSDLGAEGHRLVETRFVAGALAAGLRDGPRRDGLAGTGTDRPPCFSDLYAWATDARHDLSPAQRAMVAEDPALRRSLALLVGRVGGLRAAAAAAASSGGLDSRAGPGFALRLTVSRADPAHTYVGIEIDRAAWPSQDDPVLLLVLRDGVPVGKLALPEAHDGSIQLIEASDSPAVRGLRDAGTDIVLV